MTETAIEFINSSITKSTRITIEDADEEMSTQQKWVEFGKTKLTQKDKAALSNGHKLSDIHINAAQTLLKMQFGQFNALQSTLLQLKQSLIDSKNIIHILHVTNNHWAVMSTQENEGGIQYYDSIYSSMPEDAQEIVARLMMPRQPKRAESFKLHVEVMATQKQAGATDSGLYAIAICTSLVFNQNPCLKVFSQEDMQSHLIECLSKKNMQMFPT